MPVQKHTHQYFKAEDGTYPCARQDCSHYIPLNQIKARGMVGRKSLCWECGREFFLDSVSLQDKEPKCERCNGLEDWENAIIAQTKKNIQPNEQK